MRLAMLALAVLLTAGAAKAASLETYSRRPSMHTVLISPDGEKVAFVQRVNGKEAVVIDQLNPAAVIGNIPPGEPFSAIGWADSTHLLASGPNGVLVVDIDKRKVGRLFDRADLPIAVTSPPKVRTRAGRTTVFVSGFAALSGLGAPTLAAVDLATGKVERLARAHTGTEAWWGVDADGNVIYQEIYDQHAHVWRLQFPRGSDWIEAMSVPALYDPPHIVGQTLDGRSLVMQIYTENRGLQFRSVPTDGTPGDLVPEYAGLTQIIYDPQTYLPIGGAKEGIEPDYVFFDPKDQALWEGVVKLFPDEEVGLESWSKDRSKVVVQVAGRTHGVSYVLVDTAHHKTTGIGPVFDGLTPNDFADVAIAAYPAKDGLPIQALLTLPGGREPKNLPLVVLPKSGNAVEQVGYYEWAQAFASRGYAVLQPQFRGTFGLGWKHEFAGIGEFGRRMQTDLSDGVRALAAKGIVDDKRVCIVGGPGYGGYTALAGVIFEQGVYRCAAAINPWLDIRKVAGGLDADANHSIRVRTWDRFVGAKDPGDPIFDKISPSKHPADASAPILIIEAPGPDNDTIMFVNALHQARKSAELMPIHGVEREGEDQRRVTELQAMVTFVEKNNPAN